MIARILAALLALGVAGAAHATNWCTAAGDGCKTPYMLGAGGIATWTESSTVDSGVLCMESRTTCDNVGVTTNFSVYRASRTGTKHNGWVEHVTAGLSCSPDAGNLTCGSVVLEPGCYVFDPDGTAAASTCAAEDQGGPH